MRTLIIFIFFIFLISNFVSASVKYDNPNIPALRPPVTSIETGGNYTINVNNSQYLQGYTPTTLKDWMQGLFDDIYCKLTGCTMAGNIDMNGNAIIDADLSASSDDRWNATSLQDAYNNGNIINFSNNRNLTLNQRFTSGTIEILGSFYELGGGVNPNNTVLVVKQAGQSSSILRVYGSNDGLHLVTESGGLFFESWGSNGIQFKNSSTTAMRIFPTGVSVFYTPTNFRKYVSFYQNISFSSVSNLIFDYRNGERKIGQASISIGDVDNRTLLFKNFTILDIQASINAKNITINNSIKDANSNARIYFVDGSIVMRASR